MKRKSSKQRLAELELCAFPLTTAYAAERITVTPMIAIGYGGHMIALKADGTVWAWGRNKYGQLGNGTLTDSLIPVRVKGLTNVIAIGAGEYNGIALKADGTVWTWGINEGGQLGNGTNINSPIPVWVNTLPKITAIAAALRHILVLSDTGEIWAWGFNADRQVVNVEDYCVNTPVKVDSLSDITKIAARIISAAVTRSGELYLWGDNLYKLIHNDSTLVYDTPQQKTGIGDMTDVVIGLDCGLALQSDSKSWMAWGMIGGQFGNDEITYTDDPIKVDYGQNFITVSLGNQHTLILNSDKTVSVCGLNNHGQLGDGTNSDRTTPKKIDSLTDVIAIAAGMYSSAAITNDGTVWSWGYNLDGELGDGTKESKNIPTKVLGPGGIGYFNVFESNAHIPNNRDATIITATVTITEPHYTVTIPETIPVGVITKTTTDSIKSIPFTVNASGGADLDGKEVTISISTSDGSFNLSDGAGHNLPYQVFNVAKGGTALTSGAEFTTLTGNGSVTGRVEINQKDITATGNYTGTLTFTITLEDTSA